MKYVVAIGPDGPEAISSVLHEEKLDDVKQEMSRIHGGKGREIRVVSEGEGMLLKEALQAKRKAQS